MLAYPRLIALLLAAMLALPAQAQKLRLPDSLVEGPGMPLLHEPEQKARHQPRIISREEAVRQAQSQYPGKVLSVKLRGGGEFYSVKIIRKGHVRVVRVPAQH